MLYTALGGREKERGGKRKGREGGKEGVVLYCDISKRSCFWGQLLTFNGKGREYRLGGKKNNYSQRKFKWKPTFARKY